MVSQIRRLVGPCVGFLTLLLIIPRGASAWGPVGHRIIAENAAILAAHEWTSNRQSWGAFLERHRFELGYYSTTPDSIFRFNDGADGKVEAMTHYLVLDENPKGGLPERVDQFRDLARTTFQLPRSPSSGYAPGKGADGERGQLFKGLLYLGLMAHYTGDAAMPYHAVADFNGVSAGDEGIHFYFENDCVHALEPGLAAAALTSARKNGSRWLKEWGFTDQTDVLPALAARALITQSGKLVPKIREIDFKKIRKPGPGFTRLPARTACGALREIITEQLARASVLTVRIWKSTIADSAPPVPETFQIADIEGTPAYVPPSAPSKR